ncbi:MAG: type II toxin-antitoxin system VapB family antitoxin [Sphingomonas sp.]|nr:type II toxin-antitoxin system VapB family antitoxin [Sphingomonas sp.]
MATQLNIKDPETVALAHRLAKATGKPMTTLIREALEREEREREEKVAAKIAAIMEIAAEFRRNMPEEWRGKTSKEIMDEIYDDDGLPI